VATVLALGGSTNAFIHLIADGRPGRAWTLTLDDFDAILAPACRGWPTSGRAGST